MTNTVPTSVVKKATGHPRWGHRTWVLLRSTVGTAVVLVLLAACTTVPTPSDRREPEAPSPLRESRDTAVFAQATMEVGTVASRELARMRTQTIQMNLRRLQLAGPQTGLPSHTNLDEAFTPKVLLEQMHAAETLVSYGRLLHRLTESPEANDEEAMERFILRIKSLPLPERRLEGPPLEALASDLRDSDGKTLLDRSQRVTRLVRSSQAQIEQLYRGLAAAFDPNHIGSLGSSFIMTTERLLATTDKALASAHTAATRKPVLEALELAHANRLRRSTVLPHLAGALAALNTTHGELVEKIGSSAVTLRSLPGLRQAVMRLQTSLDMMD